MNHRFASSSFTLARHRLPPRPRRFCCALGRRARMCAKKRNSVTMPHLHLDYEGPFLIGDHVAAAGSRGGMRKCVSGVPAEEIRCRSPPADWLSVFQSMQVPWEDLCYLFGEIMYGGHITDSWDRRLCKAYLQEFMHPKMVSETGTMRLLLKVGFHLQIMKSVWVLSR